MANVTAYTALDMINPPIRDWNLLNLGSTQIDIVDGLNTGIYRGNFTYGAFGSVSGELNSFEMRYNGTIQNMISGLNLGSGLIARTAR